MSPEIVFGTGFWGTPMTEFRDVSAVANLLSVIKQHGISRIDTAARYPPTDIGGAEKLLGESSSSSFVIDTKVLTANIQDPSGDLEPDAIEESVIGSLTRLKSNNVDTLYAHLPDPTTPIKDQIAAFNLQIERGRCKQYGLSNHSVEQVKSILRVCEDQGLRKPAVYQGDYNLLTRGMESDLLPLLRRHQIRYYAYRPLAAGFLSGKAVNGDADGTRMGKESPMCAAYQRVYGSPLLHEAMKEFQTTLEKFHLSPLEVAMRWIFHNSTLTDGDGIILGTRSTDQLEQDMGWIRKGPLPSDVLAVIDGLWERLRESRGHVL